MTNTTTRPTDLIVTEHDQETYSLRAATPAGWEFITDHHSACSFDIDRRTQTVWLDRETVAQRAAAALRGAAALILELDVDEAAEALIDAWRAHDDAWDKWIDGTGEKPEAPK